MIKNQSRNKISHVRQFVLHSYFNRRSELLKSSDVDLLLNNKQYELLYSSQKLTSFPFNMESIFDLQYRYALNLSSNNPFKNDPDLWFKMIIPILERSISPLMLNSGFVSKNSKDKASIELDNSLNTLIQDENLDPKVKNSLINLKESFKHTDSNKKLNESLNDFANIKRNPQNRSIKRINYIKSTYKVNTLIEHVKNEYERLKNNQKRNIKNPFKKELLNNPDNDIYVSQSWQVINDINCNAFRLSEQDNPLYTDVKQNKRKTVHDLSENASLASSFLWFEVDITDRNGKKIDDPDIVQDRQWEIVKKLERLPFKPTSVIFTQHSVHMFITFDSFIPAHVHRFMILAVQFLFEHYTNEHTDESCVNSNRLIRVPMFMQSGSYKEKMTIPVQWNSHLYDSDKFIHYVSILVNKLKTEFNTFLEKRNAKKQLLVFENQILFSNYNDDEIYEQVGKEYEIYIQSRNVLMYEATQQAVEQFHNKDLNAIHELIANYKTILQHYPIISVESLAFAERMKQSEELRNIYTPIIAKTYQNYDEYHFDLNDLTDISCCKNDKGYTVIEPLNDNIELITYDKFYKHSYKNTYMVNSFLRTPVDYMKYHSGISCVAGAKIDKYLQEHNWNDIYKSTLDKVNQLLDQSNLSDSSNQPDQPNRPVSLVKIFTKTFDFYKFSRRYVLGCDRLFVNRQYLLNQQENQSNDKSNDQSENESGNGTDNTFKNESISNLFQDTSQDSSKDISKNVSQNVSKDISKNIKNNYSDKINYSEGFDFKINKCLSQGMDTSPISAKKANWKEYRETNYQKMLNHPINQSIIQNDNSTIIPLLLADDITALRQFLNISPENKKMSKKDAWHLILDKCGNLLARSLGYNETNQCHNSKFYQDNNPSLGFYNDEEVFDNVIYPIQRIYHFADNNDYFNGSFIDLIVYAKYANEHTTCQEAYDKAFAFIFEQLLGCKLNYYSVISENIFIDYFDYKLIDTNLLIKSINPAAIKNVNNSFKNFNKTIIDYIEESTHFIKSFCIQKLKKQKKLALITNAKRVFKKELIKVSLDEQISLLSDKKKKQLVNLINIFKLIVAEILSSSLSSNLFDHQYLALHDIIAKKLNINRVTVTRCLKNLFLLGILVRKQVTEINSSDVDINQSSTSHKLISSNELTVPNKDSSIIVVKKNTQNASDMSRTNKQVYNSKTYVTLTNIFLKSSKQVIKTRLNQIEKYFLKSDTEFEYLTNQQLINMFGLNSLYLIKDYLKVNKSIDFINQTYQYHLNNSKKDLKKDSKNCLRKTLIDIHSENSLLTKLTTEKEYLVDLLSEFNGMIQNGINKSSVNSSNSVNNVNNNIESKKESKYNLTWEQVNNIFADDFGFIYASLVNHLQKDLLNVGNNDLNNSEEITTNSFELLKKDGILYTSELVHYTNEHKRRCT